MSTDMTSHLHRAIWEREPLLLWGQRRQITLTSTLRSIKGNLESWTSR